MSVSSRMLTLKRKYEQLNNLISDELSRPMPDSIRLFNLKIKRLRLKEQIYKLA